MFRFREHLFGLICNFTQQSAPKRRRGNILSLSIPCLCLFVKVSTCQKLYIYKHIYAIKYIKKSVVFGENMLIKLITFSLLTICLKFKDESGKVPSLCSNPSMLDTIRDNNNRLLYIGMCCIQCMQNNIMEVSESIESIEWLADLAYFNKISILKKNVVFFCRSSNGNAWKIVREPHRRS